MESATKPSNLSVILLISMTLNTWKSYFVINVLYIQISAQQILDIMFLHTLGAGYFEYSCIQNLLSILLEEDKCDTVVMLETME